MTSLVPDPRLARARAVARMLDTAIGIPGTRFRFGLDPLLGLIPGLGDLVTAALSGYIVLTGMRLGAPRATVVRMLANVAVDTLAGSVPLLGDLFDASYKSNVRNLELIERHVGEPGIPPKPNRLLIVAGLMALVLIAALGIALVFVAVRALARSLG